MQNIQFASVAVTTLGSSYGVGTGGAEISFAINEAINLKPLENRRDNNNGDNTPLEEP